MTPFPQIEVGATFKCAGKTCTKTSDTHWTDGKTVVIGSMFSEFSVEFKDLSNYLAEGEL